MPFEQAFVCAQEKRTATTRGIENSQFGCLLSRFAFQQFFHCVLDNIINNVRGRVINAASFLDFRLVLDFCVVTSGEANHLAEELLIDLAKYICGQR